MTESTNVTVQVSSKVRNPKAVFYKLCKITYTISFLKIFTLKKCSTFWINLPILTILTGKNCFTQFRARMAASDLFHMFTQSIKFYTFHYHLLRVLMLETFDSSNFPFRLTSLIYAKKFEFENPAIMEDKQCKQTEQNGAKFSVMTKGSDYFLLLDDKSIK